MGEELNPNKKFGPNLKRYSNLSLGLNTFFQNQSDENYKINFPRSFQINFSRRGKQKLNSLFSFGNELGFAFKNINLKNNIPTGLVSNMVRLSRLSAIGSFYQRLNLDKNRGNRLGYFIDFGAGIECFFFSKAISEFDIFSSSYNGIKVTYRGLKELRRFDYFCYARIGAERLNIIFQIILNEQIKDKINSSLITKNLPTFKAGIEINLKN
jgi:hypothetical protein